MPFRPCKACGNTDIVFVDEVLTDYKVKVYCKCSKCGYRATEATSYDLAYEYWNNTNKEPAK